jgi:hypothetical protein
MQTINRWFTAILALVFLVAPACADLELGEPVIEAGAGGGGTRSGFAGFSETGTSTGTSTGAGEGGVESGLPGQAGEGGPNEGIPGGSGMGLPKGSASGGGAFSCNAFCDWYMTCEDNPYDPCVSFCKCLMDVFPEMVEPAAEIMKFDCATLGEDGAACSAGMDCMDPEDIETPFDDIEFEDISEETWMRLEVCWEAAGEFNWMFF